MAGLTRQQGNELVRRRHPEWMEFQRRHRFLADSYEGGNRYRYADYTLDPTAHAAGPPWFGATGTPWYALGVDPQTSVPTQISYQQIVDRNLVPHKSETDAEGAKVYAQRLSRTPVPNTLAKVVRRHLARVFSKEVKRSGPARLEAFWSDVDGRGTTMDRWVRKVAGPLLCVLGQLDVLVGRPGAFGDVEPLTRADERELNLDRVVASYVLPENMVWWRTDDADEYEECLVFVRREDGTAYYRHWTEGRCDAYDPDGDRIEEASFETGLDFVPIKRFYDEPKARCRHTGQSRYEAIAELQKAKYNARSEMVLGDVTQSHASLQCPEDFIQSETEVVTGPNGLLPMRKDSNGQYVGWSYVEPPKGAQEALRTHVQDYDDEALDDAGLQKPAGVSTRGSVGQSGISKLVDKSDGNDVVAEVAETLNDFEAGVARLALAVLGGGDDPAAADAVSVRYPKEFELFSTEQLASVIQQIQQSCSGVGQLPATEVALLTRLAFTALPGLDDSELQGITDEIKATVAAKAAALKAGGPPPDAAAESSALPTGFEGGEAGGPPPDAGPAASTVARTVGYPS